jgi:iron complex transport system permease protein
MKPFRPSAYVWSLMALILAFGLSVAVGATTVPLNALGKILLSRFPGAHLSADWAPYLETIVLRLRLPHAALVLLTGAALGGSGAAYQGLFRNPLADPYLLGVASGAGLGAVFALSLHTPQTALGIFLLPSAAFAGALGTVLLVYLLARVDGKLPPETLILAGVAVSAFAGAATSFLMLRSDGEVHRALAYLLGGAPLSGWTPVLAMLPYLLVGEGILLFSGHALNVLQFGDEQAAQLGLPVERAKRLILAAASLTTAAAVSFAGIIGFVGLIVPHILRLLWGGDYRHLLPLSVVGGGAFLLFADTLARTLLAPQSIPVGIVTALFGAPFFLWLLSLSRRQG